jgi:photosystem II stability/assembly factor-like uncharacterized protein
MRQLTVLLSSFLITLMCSVNLNAQWYEKSNGLPINCWAAAIDAYDSLIATGPYTQTSDYIPDSLYVTTNGGNNWYPIPLPDNLQLGDGLVDISIIGEDKIWFCTDLGKIYRTTDGGINWQLQFYDTLMTKFMNYVEMFDSLNGMAMGDAPAIDKPTLFLKTTNGGTDWISQNESYLIGMWGGDIWRRVDFVDINTGYFFSSGGIGKLYKTINGGKDWQVFNDTIFCNVLKGFDENIFLCEEATASLAGIIHRTIDGGQNWESEQFDFLDWGYDIEFTAGNSSNVWCASAPLSFSSDTGRTWVKEFNAPNGLFLDIVFTDENNGWLFEGVSRELINIYRTTNGGIGGIVSVDNEIDFRPDGFILEQNYPNPFNPTTIIRYQIPEISFVTIKVYDVLGNEISRMVNEEKPAGEYGVEFDGDGLTSGIYFYQLRAGDYTDTKKMILLR